MPVNWRDMETEELGSVYESLLELTPRLTDDGRGFAFAEGGETKGHARKTTGSYYTPDSLVQALLDRALDPVLDRVEAEADDPASRPARRSPCSIPPAAPAISCSRRRAASPRGSRAPAPAASPRRPTIAMRCAMSSAPASTASTAIRLAVDDELDRESRSSFPTPDPCGKLRSCFRPGRPAQGLSAYAAPPR